MTPDLVALKQRVLNTEKQYLFWAAAHVGGKTAEQLVEIDVAYRKASRAYSEAMDAYNAALKEATQ